MNKGIKALSAVLALSMGLIGANLVSAENNFTVNDISKEALELLKVKEKTATVLNKYYESVTKDASFGEDLEAAEEALKNVAKDSAAQAKLNLVACNAAQAVEAIDNELKASKHLMELAKTLHQNGSDLPLVEDTELEKAVTSVRAKRFFGGDYEKMEALIKQYNENKDEKITKAGIFTDATSNEAVQKNAADDIKKLVARVGAAAYQEAAERVSYYTEGVVNDTVISLRAQKVNLVATAKIAAKVAAEHGLKITACALPADLLIDEKVTTKTEKKAEKKDAVPNTAANHQFLFKPIVPTLTHKHEDKAAEQKALFPTFADLQNVELIPATPAKSMSKEKAAEQKALFPTFADLQGVELIPSK